MINISSAIDASFASTPLILSVIQSGSQISAKSSYISQLSSGVYVSTTSGISLSGSSRGEIELILADSSGNVAWSQNILVSSSGTRLYGTDSNVKYLNDVPLIGDGSYTNKWRA